MANRIIAAMKGRATGRTTVEQNRPRGATPVAPPRDSVAHGGVTRNRRRPTAVRNAQGGGDFRGRGASTWGRNTQTATARRERLRGRIQTRPDDNHKPQTEIGIRGAGPFCGERGRGGGMIDNPKPRIATPPSLINKYQLTFISTNNCQCASMHTNIHQPTMHTNKYQGVSRNIHKSISNDNHAYILICTHIYWYL